MQNCTVHSLAGLALPTATLTGLNTLMDGKTPFLNDDVWHVSRRSKLRLTLPMMKQASLIPSVRLPPPGAEATH